jgi:hypothetical protein
MVAHLQQSGVGGDGEGEEEELQECERRVCAGMYRVLSGMVLAGIVQYSL